ncbi:hypothetical protein L218DRAFT_951660 [Marasmius fiardii PR-910]|nr:hypothetical protein L218DRAFT_951660 [Marasmius fiardii PR-910]
MSVVHVPPRSVTFIDDPNIRRHNSRHPGVAVPVISRLISLKRSEDRWWRSVSAQGRTKVKVGQKEREAVYFPGWDMMTNCARCEKWNAGNVKTKARETLMVNYLYSKEGYFGWSRCLGRPVLTSWASVKRKGERWYGRRLRYWFCKSTLEIEMTRVRCCVLGGELKAEEGRKNVRMDMNHRAKGKMNVSEREEQLPEEWLALMVVVSRGVENGQKRRRELVLMVVANLGEVEPIQERKVEELQSSKLVSMFHLTTLLV